MKIIVLFIISAFLTTPAIANESPELILPKTKVIMSVNWYKEQAEIWKKQIEKHPSEALAWVNFYMSTRFSHAPQSELDKIINDMSEAVPETYEVLLVKSWNEGFSETAFENLKRAYALQPHNTASYGLLALMHEFNDDALLRKEFARKLMSAGEVSSSLLNYSYNVLMSLERDAILFTEGDNTTLPLFLLQDVMNIRQDVAILDLDMLVKRSYRETKLNSLQLSLNSSNMSVPALEQKQFICSALPIENSNKKFYYALTLSKDNILNIKDQLYVVGLASQLSSKRIDNISLIKDNLEKHFMLDYLTVDFNGEGEFAAGRVLQSNYLVPMLLLKEHYEKAGEAYKAKQLEALVIKIANESGKGMLVQNLLNRGKAEEAPIVPFNLNLKAVEGGFRLIKDNIYAFNYEVTNADYNAFLQYLLDSKNNDLYEKHKVDLSRYDEPALSYMKTYHMARPVNKKEKYFTNYPIVNIDYEDAVAYCEWLTQHYNNNAERKFKKVRFRLPSLNEWQVSAAGISSATSWVLAENSAEVKIYEAGKEFSKHFDLKTVSLSEPDINYPWFKHYNMRNTVMNEKGWSLGNFKFPDTVKPCVPPKQITQDGFVLMSPAGAYFPNDVGLYDVVGNVAEMTDEKGKACGGSWNHSPEESTIRSVNNYDGPQSDIGFRIFMEVIEQ